jgi:hypothetical protein
MTYNRSAIMREANRLTRLGMPRAEAMRAAWASAKATTMEANLQASLQGYAHAQQPSGLRASLKRYGIDPDKLALRAQGAVKAIIAAIAERPALLPPPVDAKTIDLTRGTDGVYRI